MRKGRLKCPCPRCAVWRERRATRRELDQWARSCAERGETDEASILRAFASYLKDRQDGLFSGEADGAECLYDERPAAVIRFSRAIA